LPSSKRRRRNNYKTISLQIKTNCRKRLRQKTSKTQSLLLFEYPMCRPSEKTLKNLRWKVRALRELALCSNVTHRDPLVIKTRNERLL
jgi:hypothetical protein